MNICVVGTGYVGLVAGTCFSDLGFRVTCVDTAAEKIRALQHGEVPIYEPGLESLIRRNVREGRLHFTLDAPTALAAADVVFIAVGTPGLPDGSADLSAVMAVASAIAEHRTRRVVAVIKSTVPVGTADKVRAILEGKGADDFDVVSNPEFLKEGAAIEDFMRPDRIVVGCRKAWAREVMQELYAGLVRTGRPILFMDNRSAELTKYASNAMLATKISFMNEIARLCDAVGADVELVRQGVGSDTRIGPRFLFPGVGYGGSCFPKDVKALIQTAHEYGVVLKVPEAVEEVNEAQKSVLSDKVLKRFGADLHGRRFAVWGIAFKPETDDIREAPALVIIEQLVRAGATVQAYDPEAMGVSRRMVGDHGGHLIYTSSAMDALNGADALLLVTEWHEFRHPELDEMKSRMSQHILFDGRNIYDPEKLRAAGFEVFGIGRP